MADNTLKQEKQFIYLLLKEKDLVNDYVASSLSPNCFHMEHQNILRGIEHAYEQNVKLTRFSYSDFIGKLKSPKERLFEETAFNSCLASVAKPDDFPLLANAIFEGYVMRKTGEEIHSFQNSVNDSGIMHSFKSLVENLQNISVDSESSRGKSVYDNIGILSKEYFIHKEKVRSGEIKTPPRVLCGIKEIDETMGTGFAPGTMTLICADVGGFKSELHSTVISLANGGRKTVEELYRMQEKGQNLPQIISLTDNSKLFKQSPLKILDHGVLPCVILKTKRGFEITNTLKHRHLLLDGYKKTEDIKVGDSLAISRHQYFGKEKATEGLATWLGCMISDGGCSQPSYSFTNFDNEIVHEMTRATILIGGNVTKIGYTIGNILKGHYHINSTRKYGKQYRIDGKTALQKEVPSQIFHWDKSSLVDFLQAMYGCDGSICKEKTKRKSGNTSLRYKIQYHTSSKKLSIDVRDLLIKFGIIASIFSYPSSYKKDGIKIEKGITYRVIIQDTRQVEKFIKEIGFLGVKQKECEEYLEHISSIKSNPNGDVIPDGIWGILGDKFKKYGKSFYGCRRHLKVGEKGRGKEGYCGNKGKAISRRLLNKIAEYLDNDEELLSIANSDIYWDKIISIEPVGYHQVYDIAMPVNHNFVANNIITHNSMMMMNLGLNVWELGYDVLFVPIEMAKEQVFERIWSRQSNVLQEKIQKAEYTDEEAEKIKIVIDKFENGTDNKFFVMQVPGDTTVSIIERQVRKYHDIFQPKLVVVDYIDNLESDKARDRHDLEISDMLQKLRTMGRDLGFGVLSGAQLGRDALKRIRKAGSSKEGTSVNSEDLRGAHSFAMDSDYILAQVPNPAQPESLLDIYVVKARNGKKVFPNGHMKASLELYPEVQLIKSISDFDMSDDAILDKVTMFENVENQIPKSEGIDAQMGFDGNIANSVDDFGFEDF